MTIRAIVINGDPVLHTPTAPVERFDDELRQLVDDMFDTMDRAHGVGLAANQIGVGLRVFVFDCPTDLYDPSAPNLRGVVINPKLEVTGEPETDEEGCLSLPGASFPTERMSWARVTGVDVAGEPVAYEGSGFFARCLQHECGHLDGFVYTDVLKGRWKKAAAKAIRREGWTDAGLTWMPGVDPDPFSHED